MQDLNIGLLCMQETHRAGSSYFVQDGFLVIFSGTDSEEREWAGVGFVVAPWLRHAVCGFIQFSSRLASIRIRIPGGSACFISAYAPHDGKNLTIRADFFHDLAAFTARCRTHGPTYVVGDLNARLHVRFPSEEQVVGNHFFKIPSAKLDGHDNRDLFLEMCISASFVIANTFSRYIWTRWSHALT